MLFERRPPAPARLPKARAAETSAAGGGPPALQPLLQTRAFVCGHAVSLGCGFRRLVSVIASSRAVGRSPRRTAHPDPPSGAGFGSAARAPRCRRSGFRRTAHVFGDQRRDLADGAGAHQAGGRQGDADGASIEFSISTRHQRIEAQIGQRLVSAQALRLDAQDGADDVAHGLADDARRLSPARRTRSCARQSLLAPPVSGSSPPAAKMRSSNGFSLDCRGRTGAISPNPRGWPSPARCRR